MSDPTPIPDTAAPALPDELRRECFEVGRDTWSRMQQRTGEKLDQEYLTSVVDLIVGKVLDHVAVHFADWRQINDAMLRQVLDERDQAQAGSGAAALTDSNAVIAKLQEIADQYPADVFTPAGKTPDGIAGTAIRERMLAEIRHLREDGDGGE